jgi:hypothetical protein
MDASTYRADLQSSPRRSGTRSRHRRTTRTLGERAAVPAQAGVKLAVAGLIGTALTVSATAALAAPILASPTTGTGTGTTSTGIASLTAAMIAPIPLPPLLDVTPGPPYPAYPVSPGTSLGAVTIIDGPKTITFSGDPQDPVHITDLSQQRGYQDLDMPLGTIYLSENHCVLGDNGCTAQFQPGTYNAGDVKIAYLPMIPVSDDATDPSSPDQATVIKVNDTNGQPNTDGDTLLNMLNGQQNQDEYSNSFQGIINSQLANMSIGNLANNASPDWGSLSRLVAVDPTDLSAYAGLQPAKDATSTTAPVASAVTQDNGNQTSAADDDSAPPVTTVDNGSPPVTVADNYSDDSSGDTA